MAKIKRQARQLELLTEYAAALEQENATLRERVQELEQAAKPAPQAAKPGPAKKAAAAKTTGH